MKSLYSKILDCINEHMDKKENGKDDKLASFILASLHFYNDLCKHEIIKK